MTRSRYEVDTLLEVIFIIYQRIEEIGENLEPDGGIHLISERTLKAEGNDVEDFHVFIYIRLSDSMFANICQALDTNL